ncbi:MAG: DUF2177 family protein [Erysipelotrichaceae bacterium]
MQQFMKLYGIAFVVFFIIDILWLAVFAKGFYQKQLGFLMRANVAWFAAIAFYLIYIFALVALILIPAVQQEQGYQWIWRAALFGFVCYATYDLTNLATIKDWPILVTVVDLVWGTLVSVLVGVATYAIYFMF